MVGAKGNVVHVNGNSVVVKYRTKMPKIKEPDCPVPVESYDTQKPVYGGYILVVDATECLKKSGKVVQDLNEKYGNVWTTSGIIDELEGIKNEPKSSHKRNGIKDYCAFLRIIRENTLRLDREPYFLPTFSEMLSSGGEKGDAARKINDAENVAFAGEHYRNELSYRDKELLAGPVLMNGYGKGEPKTLWFVCSGDGLLRETGRVLDDWGYPMISVCSMEEIDSRMVELFPGI